MTQDHYTPKNAKAQRENLAVFFDDPGRLRVMVESVIQEIIEAEFEDYIGVKPDERKAERRDYRDSYKLRCSKTRV